MPVLPLPGLADALVALLPAGAIAGVSGLLCPEELAHVAPAVASRREEFRAGRLYSRRVLAQLDLPGQAIPASVSRTPQWPHGHVRQHQLQRPVCAAIAGRQIDFLGFDLDLEAGDALDDDLKAIVCTRVRTRIDLPKLLFVIKEAVHKLYWPLVQHFLDFGDLSVRLNAAPGAFTATLAPDCPDARGSRSFTRRFAGIGRSLCAVAALPNPARAGSPPLQAYTSVL